jgi:hypothetical protein
MAVRDSWYLVIAWRKSSVSNTDESCVQVALCESSLVSRDQCTSSAQLPSDHG